MKKYLSLLSVATILFFVIFLSRDTFASSENLFTENHVLCEGTQCVNRGEEYTFTPARNGYYYLSNSAELRVKEQGSVIYQRQVRYDGCYDMKYFYLKAGVTYTMTFDVDTMQLEDDSSNEMSCRICKASEEAGSIYKISTSSKGITLSWIDCYDNCYGTTNYKIYRKCSGQSWKLIKTYKGKNCPTDSTAAYTDTGLKSGTVASYEYMIKIDDAQMLYMPYGKTTSISYIGKPCWKSARNVSRRRLSLTWKKISKVSGYQICYSTRSNYSGAKYIKTKNVSRTLGSMKKGKKYYVRIRAYKGKVYGAWSTTKCVKIKK